MTNEKATLNCRCGKCRSTLRDPEMRYPAVYLCADPRQRGLISASRASGNELPPAVVAYERGGANSITSLIQWKAFRNGGQRGVTIAILSFARCSKDPAPQVTQSYRSICEMINPRDRRNDRKLARAA